MKQLAVLAVIAAILGVTSWLAGDEQEPPFNYSVTASTAPNGITMCTFNGESWLADGPTCPTEPKITKPSGRQVDCTYAVVNMPLGKCQPAVSELADLPEIPARREK